MKIMKVEAIPFRLPLRPEVGPVKSSIWSMSAADHVLIRVITNEGIVGHGEAPQRPTIYGET
jgi:L-Ala-D/L-Glu epimerase